MREVIKTDVIKDDDESVELEFELGDESEIIIRFDGKELAIADWPNIREIFERAIEIWPDPDAKGSAVSERPPIFHHEHLSFATEPAKSEA